MPGDFNITLMPVIRDMIIKYIMSLESDQPNPFQLHSATSTAESKEGKESNKKEEGRQAKAEESANGIYPLLKCPATRGQGQVAQCHIL